MSKRLGGNIICCKDNWVRMFRRFRCLVIGQKEVLLVLFVVALYYSRHCNLAILKLKNMHAPQKNVVF